MSAKVINRDNKGRFCSSRSDTLKSMSILVDTTKKDIDAETLIQILNKFYKTNVSFIENAIRIYRDVPSRRCQTKSKVNEPSINFTVSWETV